jgi:signal recognition particle subunit SRP54
VSLPTVRQFVKRVEEKALGVTVIKGVKPEQMLVRVVNDELVELMGGKKEGLNDPDDGPQVSHPPILEFHKLGNRQASQ